MNPPTPPGATPRRARLVRPSLHPSIPPSIPRSTARSLRSSTPRSSAGWIRRPGTRLAGAAGIAVLVSACGLTTSATPVTTTTIAVAATTTTLPAGTAAELLPRLRTEVASLAGVMIAEGDDGEVLDRVLALWEATRAEIGQRRPDLVPGFQQNVALAEKAVQFSRAADADKAAKNIDALVSAFLGD